MTPKQHRLIARIFGGVIADLAAESARCPASRDIFLMAMRFWAGVGLLVLASVLALLLQ